MPGRTWEYVSRVIALLEWPSISLTTFMGSPARHQRPGRVPQIMGADLRQSCPLEVIGERATESTGADGPATRRGEDEILVTPCRSAGRPQPMLLVLLLGRR
jgi:hypothetical protein